MAAVGLIRCLGMSAVAAHAPPPAAPEAAASFRFRAASRSAGSPSLLGTGFGSIPAIVFLAFLASLSVTIPDIAPIRSIRAAPTICALR